MVVFGAKQKNRLRVKFSESRFKALASCSLQITLLLALYGNPKDCHDLIILLNIPLAGEYSLRQDSLYISARLLNMGHFYVDGLVYVDGGRRGLLDKVHSERE